MGSPPPDPRSESRKLIAEYEQTLKSAKEKHEVADEVSGRRRKFRRAAILGGALVVAGYLAVNPPGWTKPEPAPPPTPAELTASDRFAIFLQAQRIEHFRNTTGRLPSTLEEAGEPMLGVRFKILGAGEYALTSDRDPTIRYMSSDSLGTFLEGSLTLLGGDQR